MLLTKYFISDWNHFQHFDNILYFLYIFAISVYNIWVETERAIFNFGRSILLENTLSNLLFFKYNSDRRMQHIHPQKAAESV